MGLAIRMILYAVFAGLAGVGLGDLDAEGVYSVRVEDLAEIIIGAIGFLGTFWASRVAKRNGGVT